MKTKTNRIVIYKIKSDIGMSSIDLRKSGYSVEHDDGECKLFVHKTGRTPQWLSYIQPYITSNPSLISNQNCSFVLIHKHNNNIYAVSGGYGFSELKGVIETDFGRDLALRMIKEKEISAIGQRSMKGNVRQIYRAVIKYDPVFDRDNFNRILNSIEGKAEFEGRNFRITGRSSIMLRTVKDIRRLNEVLSEVEEIMEKPERTNFPKSYKEVTDKATVGQLDERLFGEFSTYYDNITERENLYAEFRDPVAQFRSCQFIIKYKRRSYEHEEFDLDVIVSALKKDGLTIDRLEDLNKIHLTAINEFGYYEVNNESMYNMLICELNIDGSSFIKYYNTWYKILEEIQNYYDEELKKLPVDRNLIPPWDKKIYKKENEFNKYIAGLKSYECLDTDCVQIKGLSKIELCDLYDKENNTFYHIKETWGCKSAYLFTQGSTAAEYFRQSKEFRKKCREKWPTLFANEIGQAKMVFGIAAPKASAATFPMNMTYFAKLNLYNAVTSLKMLDFNVVLAPIDLI